MASMSSTVAAEPAWFFGSPILTVNLPNAEALNEELASLILKLEKEQATLSQSNRGGWQSKKTLQTVQCDSVNQLLSSIRDAESRMMHGLVEASSSNQVDCGYRIVAWANINRQSHYNTPHFHVGGFWSGVYYVSMPSNMSNGEGTITFRNPTLVPLLANVIRSPYHLKTAFPHVVDIKPKPGMLLLFPSWLEHAVAPHSQHDERISIGYDIIYEKKV